MMIVGKPAEPVWLKYQTDPKITVFSVSDGDKVVVEAVVKRTSLVVKSCVKDEYISLIFPFCHNYYTQTEWNGESVHAPACDFSHISEFMKVYNHNVIIVISMSTVFSHLIGTSANWYYFRFPLVIAQNMPNW